MEMHTALLIAADHLNVWDRRLRADAGAGPRSPVNLGGVASRCEASALSGNQWVMRASGAVLARTIALLK